MTFDLGNSTTAVRPGARELPPDMVVAVSAEDRARGQLPPEALRAAHAAFHTHGCLLLRGLFSPAAMDAMHQDYVARYGTLDRRAMSELAARPVPNPIRPSGEGRFEVTLRMSGAFLRPDVFANPVLRGVLAPLLGADMQLNSFVVVVSYPGAPMQEIHRTMGICSSTSPISARACRSMQSTAWSHSSTSICRSGRPGYGPARTGGPRPSRRSRTP